MILVFYFSHFLPSCTQQVAISAFVEALIAILLYTFFPFVFMYTTPAVALHWAAIFENK